MNGTALEVSTSFPFLQIFEVNKWPIGALLDTVLTHEYLTDISPSPVFLAAYGSFLFYAFYGPVGYLSSSSELLRPESSPSILADTLSIRRIYPLHALLSPPSFQKGPRSTSASTCTYWNRNLR
ncbi:hypothetical protein C7212DRAFT_341858 [Tuber magnatum]|uniref:Uncharacterized protein n=1 Tax=Tuber magnatum TaxID=42249 RepID=A0A317SYS0_9PEZI|nr:hypothetical protein C7212DRAFT_341858 [Tuber magnatum]